MSKEIYFFSGTGNSLAVARDIARDIGGQLLPVTASDGKNRIETQAEMIGLVFPVYHQGLPLIISRFVDKISELDNKYIFAVCTYGDSPGLTLTYLERQVQARGGILAAGFAVNMPYNYITPSFTLAGFFDSFVLREVNEQKQHKMFADWEKRRQDIYAFIQGGKRGTPEIKSAAIEHVVDLLNLRETLQKMVWLKVAGFKGHTDLPFRESIHLMDYGFYSDDKCTGCEICSKVCPVNNIKVVDGRPVWRHHCEQCLACLQWCPQESIQFGGQTPSGKRYHHPAVSLSDMIRRDFE